MSDTRSWVDWMFATPARNEALRRALAEACDAYVQEHYNKGPNTITAFIGIDMDKVNSGDFSRGEGLDPNKCPECNEPFDEHEHDAHGFKGGCKPSPEPPADGGLDSIMGKWPGNETDKQIAEALGEELEPLDEWWRDFVCAIDLSNTDANLLGEAIVERIAAERAKLLRAIHDGFRSPWIRAKIARLAAEEGTAIRDGS